MFARFTERAKRVVVLALQEALALNSNHIGAEHLLLGLLREGEGVAAGVLHDFHVSLEDARAAVPVRGHSVGSSEVSPPRQLPFTPQARHVLESASGEAQRIGHSCIDTEDILLALTLEKEGVAVQILLKLGAAASSIRSEVMARVSGRPCDNGLQRGSAGDKRPVKAPETRTPTWISLGDLDLDDDEDDVYGRDDSSSDEFHIPAANLWYSEGRDTAARWERDIEDLEPEDWEFHLGGSG